MKYYRNFETSALMWATSLALLIAVLPMPLEYYVLLQIFASVMCIWVFIRAGLGEDLTKIVFGCLAVTYNPLFFIDLTREWWIVMDFAGIAAFMIRSFRWSK